MNKEPIKHHYIPKFILRNFCFEKERTYFYSVKKQSLSIRNLSTLFEVRNLYRDEINNSNPIQIENDLSGFEYEASVILKKFLSSQNEIVLTVEENEKLMLFFAVMGFRSKKAKDVITKGKSQDFYNFWQKNGDLSDFWKRNLSYIVKCRNIDEVLNNPHIDEPIKAFMIRDTGGIFGAYFVLAERRGDEDFVLSDSYPVNITGVFEDGKETPMYSYFPISPSRILIMVYRGSETAPQHVRMFNDDFFNQPRYSSDRSKIRFHLKKLYKENVSKINKDLIENADEGFIVMDCSRVESLKNNNEKSPL